MKTDRRLASIPSCSFVLAAALACGGGGPAATGTAESGETSAGSEGQSAAKVVFRIEVDPNAPRLDNFGQPASLAEGNAAQSPEFHAIAAHYLELTPTPVTPLSAGEVLFESAHTERGGASAVDFSAMGVTEPGAVFVEIPISDIAPGSYPYARLALSYEEFDLDFRAEVAGQQLDLQGRLGAFVEELTYVESLDLNGETLDFFENKSQGFWAFHLPGYGVEQGQVPAGSITVPNPLDATSPIPTGSCVVTGAFDDPLIIRGDESEDIEVTITLSSNQSFEWSDPNANGLFEPLAGELPVDMGIRGMSLRSTPSD